MIELVFCYCCCWNFSCHYDPKTKQKCLKRSRKSDPNSYKIHSTPSYADDKYENFISNQPKPWFKLRWGITFNETSLKECSIDKQGVKTWKYSVFFDKSLNGNVNSEREVANDIYKSGKLLSGGWSGISTDACKKINKELNLGKRFGITLVDFKRWLQWNAN